MLFRKYFFYRFIAVSLFVLILSTQACLAAPGTDNSFLRKDERILIIGDSITHTGTYVRMVYEAIKHYHPEADIQVNGLGINGVASDHQYTFSKEMENPTLVTIMLGMNNIIHYGYSNHDDDLLVQNYVRDMTAKIKSFQEKGADVVLLTPTLTDEAFSREFWELRGTRKMLVKLGQAVRQMAQAEHVWFVPVQEEFEALQNRLPSFSALRPDGVHPSAVGQYQIARTIIEHLNFPGQLIDKKETREIGTSFKSTNVKVSLTGKFVGDQLSLHFESDKAQKLNVRWSINGKTTTVQLDIDGELTWNVPIRQEELINKPGDHQQLLLSLSNGESMQWYVVDLSCVPVLHLKDNRLLGQITTDERRDEGSLVGTWSLQKFEDGLFIEGKVFDDDIQSLSQWPWGRDNVTLWLDLRPEDRFAGIGFEEDVYQSIIAVQDKPAFACSLHPWQGRGMELAANVGGQKIPNGWQWNIYINHAFFEKNKLNINERDYIGFNINILDEDVMADKKIRRKFYTYHKAKYEMFIYPNMMVLIDLKNQLKEDNVITQCLTNKY
jgi:lysophospholipase L1-like esterase